MWSHTVSLTLEFGGADTQPSDSPRRGNGNSYPALGSPCCFPSAKRGDSWDSKPHGTWQEPSRCSGQSGPGVLKGVTVPDDTQNGIGKSTSSLLYHLVGEPQQISGADKEVTQCNVLDHPARQGSPLWLPIAGKGTAGTSCPQRHPSDLQRSPPHICHKETKQRPASHKGKVRQEGEEDHHHPGIWTSNPEKHK